MTPENLLTEWARLLVVSLADAGLRDVVVSPGSRSTPLVAAALGVDRFRLFSVVDERSAAFFALGRAKATGRPAAVLCTSGSAAANYFPAVVEASTARVPLLVITADRPFELHDCGASQTMDQTRLYGGFARRFVELGMPDIEPSALVAIRRRAAQCIADSLGPEPGPVHVNVRARKPLEPARADSDAGRALSRAVDEVLALPMSNGERGPSLPAPFAIARVATAIRAARRGVIVCGPAEIGEGRLAPHVVAVANATGFPVYAETTSQLRFRTEAPLPRELLLDGLDVLLRAPSFRASFAPDLVLQLGEPPTSGAWERFVSAHPALERHVFARGGWPDPTSSAHSLVIADPAVALAELAVELGPARPRGDWQSSLAVANAAAWAAVDDVLAEERELSEGAALRTVVDTLPGGALFGVGNSLPVRHADVYCPARATELGVWSQRGVSGIDGVVSGAAGACDASGRPTVLVVGDVSALHDVGGLATAKDVSAPFVVVVLNNGGGRIFEQLPIAGAGLDAAAERFWTTPHAVRFDHVARAFALPHDEVSTRTALVEALQRGLARKGCSVVEAMVPPHGARDRYARLAAATDARLSAARGRP